MYQPWMDRSSVPMTAMPRGSKALPAKGGPMRVRAPYPLTTTPKGHKFYQPSDEMSEAAL